jgi:hypothetical protein
LLNERPLDGNAFTAFAANTKATPCAVAKHARRRVGCAMTHYSLLIALAISASMLLKDQIATAQEILGHRH